jgi:hypothetical protein
VKNSSNHIIKIKIHQVLAELRRIFKKQKSEKSEFYFGKSEKSEKKMKKVSDFKWKIPHC